MNWQEQFDKEFDDGGGTGELHLVLFPDIKSFITTLLADQKREIRKIIPKKLRTDTPSDGENLVREGRNQIIDEIINSLK